MSASDAYADLGGGLQGMHRPGRHTPTSRPITPTAGTVCTRHLFDPVSGWCGCGTRDDGKLAEGSPAWRAAVERRMPETGGTA